MKKRSDTPSRGEVTEKVDKHEIDMNEKAEELDTIASDTETVRDTISSLNNKGTSEGCDSVTNSMEQAENVTVEIFDREDENLETIQNETEEYEDELQERCDASETDIEKITDATESIETQETSTELDQAKDEVTQDLEFLTEHKEKSDQARQESDKAQQALQARVHGKGR